MNLGLKEKVIIVTGGAKGIGEGISESLALESAMVAIVGRNEVDNLKCIEKIQATGGQAFSFVAELSDPNQCKKVIEEIYTKFGRIDGLVNNAGINDGVGLANGTYEKFIQSLHSNLIHYYCDYQFFEKLQLGPILKLILIVLFGYSLVILLV